MLCCSVNDIARIVTTEGKKLGLDVEVRRGYLLSFVGLVVCCVVGRDTSHHREVGWSMPCPCRG